MVSRFNESRFYRKYQLTGLHLSERADGWSEEAVQQIWFDGWLREPVLTEDGQPITIFQPGIWRRGSGPDFQRATIAFGEEPARCGDVEVDMRPQDWIHHGHDRNRDFNNVVLHAVWELSPKRIYIATENFTHVPQVELRSQLLVDESALRDLLADGDEITDRPLSLPGACRREFEKLGADSLLGILRDAARYRLERKGRRWCLRASGIGEAQVLWEALAEGLGYHENKVAFRLLSRRARIKDLLRMDFDVRSALLLGMANLLPEPTARIRDANVLAHLKTLWSYWWRLRSDHGEWILPQDFWVRSQVRPWNQPLRRLAGLCALSKSFSLLLKALQKGDAQLFMDLLLSAEDSFWSDRLSWRGKKLDRKYPLIGAERARDLLVNVFWPWMLCRNVSTTSVDGGVEILRQLEKLKCGWNHKTRIAYDRIVPRSIKKSVLENALYQQGLLQVYEDYCIRDESACARCPMPKEIAKV